MSTGENVPEMGRHLRQIVDNAFEEGHFESGVAILSQLRSPDHKPSLIHILHLIFIALHPIQESQLNEEERLDPKALLSQSPRKMIKHSKSSMTLSASAVIAAQQLLLSFLSTNSAQYMGTALPCYPKSKNEPPMEFPFSESLIFNQSVAIKHSKNCWEILKSNFKARTTHLLDNPKAKGKGRQSSRIRFVEPSYGDTDDSLQDIKVVADDSWFVLEWLVSLFEKDADATERQGQRRHSPLLLNQLPPPPIDSSARWDASEPVRVIFYALQQSDAPRRRSGVRLLTLLVELSQTPYLNLPSFATSVLAQLTANADTTTSQFDILFTHLTSAPASLSFKLALCKKIIEDASDSSRSSSDNRKVSASRARPADIVAGSHSNSTKPRARVRTTAGDGSAEVPTSTPNDNGNTSSQSSNSFSYVPTTYVARLPSYSELVQLLKTTLLFFTFALPKQSPESIHLPNKKWATLLLLARVKFELLLAYVLVQLHRSEMSDQQRSSSINLNENIQLDPPDAEFFQSIGDGSFAAIVRQLFDGVDGDEQMILYRDVIAALTGCSFSEENMVIG